MIDALQSSSLYKTMEAFALFWSIASILIILVSMEPGDMEGYPQGASSHGVTDGCLLAGSRGFS